MNSKILCHTIAPYLVYTNSRKFNQQTYKVYWRDNLFEALAQRRGIPPLHHATLDGVIKKRLFPG